MIYINDRVRISKFDDKNLQIEILTIINKKKNGIKTGEKEEKWIWCGYYGDLKTALLGILRKELFNTSNEETTIHNLISKIDLAENNIVKAIQELTRGKNEKK